MKPHYLTLLLVVGLAGFCSAQTGWEVAVGGHQYFVPIKNTTLGHWQPQVSGGVSRFMNHSSHLNLTLRMTYQRNKHQGDALSWQMLFQYNPVVAKHVELGIGTGIGYQVSFYPDKSWRWDGANWSAGRSTKGVMQLPLQFSIGYRGIEANRGTFVPYVAYNTNFLFRYSPDLTPLPGASFMMGLKYQPILNQKN